MLGSSAASAQTTEQKLPYTAAASKDPDTAATTVGTKFTVATAGKVMGVEFFRVDSQNRATTVQLWGSGSTALATASGVPSTNGWVRANFATPVSVSPGTTYTASYFAPSGHYSHRLHGWDVARTGGDLTAPVGAGLYRYGSSAAKPNSLYQNEDYFVTPVFVADVVAPPTTTTTTPPPTTTTTAPPPPPGGQACPALPAFPDANCTGVPAGTTLATVNGNLTTTADNQVIDAKLITGDLVVQHNNVTVTNSQIKGRVAYAPGKRDLTLRDVDLGMDSCPTSGGSDYELLSGSDYTLTRVHMHHWPADLLRLAGDPNTQIIVEDSLINQACFYAGDHLDAVQMYDPGSVANVTIRHSNIDTRPVNATDKGNSAIFWADNPGAGSNLLVQDSKLAGGQITLALYDATAGSGVVLDAHNNTFVDGSWNGAPCSRGSGPVSVMFNGTEGVKFANNTLDTGGAVTC